MSEKVTLSYNGEDFEFPIIEGTENEKAIDISKLRSITYNFLYSFANSIYKSLSRFIWISGTWVKIPRLIMFYFLSRKLKINCVYTLSILVQLKNIN